jgi:hypothetical protein
LLSFDKDDIIIIKEKYEDGWYFGQCEGREGMFPAELVRRSFPVQSCIGYSTTTNTAPQRNEITQVEMLMGAPKSNEIILQNTKTLRRNLPTTPKYARNASGTQP